MGIKRLHLLAAGNSPQTVDSICGSFSVGGLTATGTNKATSLPLPGASNYISLCSSGKGASLPADAIQGDEIEVFNGGLNTCLIYSPIGTNQTITTGSANGGFSVATFKSAKFRLVTSSLWMVNYSA